MLSYSQWPIYLPAINAISYSQWPAYLPTINIIRIGLNDQPAGGYIELGSVHVSADYSNIFKLSKKHFSVLVVCIIFVSQFLGNNNFVVKDSFNESIKFYAEWIEKFVGGPDKSKQRHQKKSK